MDGALGHTIARGQLRAADNKFSRMNVRNRADFQHLLASKTCPAVTLASSDKTQRGSPAPVFGNQGRVIVCAKSDIEPGEDTGGDAALPSEEAMRHAFEGGGADHFHPLSQGSC